MKDTDKALQDMLARLIKMLEKARRLNNAITK